eukprot:3993911-Amphidinium_carterae.1
MPRLNRSWSMRRSLTQAKTLAPKLFSHLDSSVPIRWQRNPKESSTGRPAKIKDAPARVLPNAVWDRTFVDHTNNRWQSIESLLRFIQLMDGK